MHSKPSHVVLQSGGIEVEVEVAQQSSTASIQHHPPTMDTLSGSYSFPPIQLVQYGPGSISHLPAIIEKLVTHAKPMAMIVTGNSLATKTPVIKDAEELLKKHGMYGCTFKNIAQHARECCGANRSSMVPG